jgi:carbon-monoxide dehydrogenase large subunit
MSLTMDVVATNAVPTSPIRGAARPNATFITERAIDAIARALGIDRAEIRRKNFIPADAFPYEFGLAARYGGKVTYDSGDYEGALEAALTLSDHDGFEERRRAAVVEGRRLGIGIAAYVEDTGLGPHEQAIVEMDAAGAVTVITGAGSQGQGHATVLSQIVASALGVDPRSVTIRSADTINPGTGVPTVASRTAVTAGSSTSIAAENVADLVRGVAADMLEAAAADLILDEGYVTVAGQPDVRLSLAEVAAAAVGTGVELRSSESFGVPRPPYAFGCHVVEAEVDTETGLVTILNYSVAHDCGTILNPMIVDGQIDGGVAHGLSNALYERIVYSEDGQPLTTTFMDFRIPTAVEMPPLSKVHTVTPSPDNPLGVKGAGEGGTIPAMAAVAAAVEDALSDLGVVVDRYPLTPSVVRAMIEEAAK